AVVPVKAIADKRNRAVAADEEDVITRVGLAVEIERVAAQVDGHAGLVGVLNDREGSGIALELDILKRDRIGRVSEAVGTESGAQEGPRFEQFQKQPRALAGTPPGHTSRQELEEIHDHLRRS